MASHPFHKEREMDGARIILTLTEKNSSTGFDLLSVQFVQPVLHVTEGAQEA
jgi:hypothetical protein